MKKIFLEKCLIRISEKTDGQMKLESNFKEALKNRKNFFKKFGLDYESQVFSAEAVHGSKIKIINSKNKQKRQADIDGLISSQKEIYLAVTAADCLPIFFYDEKREVFAIAHAGWRGVVDNIGVKMLEKFVKNFSSLPKDINIFIGPHIRKCHFEIKKESLDFYKKYSNSVFFKKNLIYVDLSKIVYNQLVKKGIKPEKIKISKECTFCKKDKYFSYRRDKPKKLQTMIAFIGLKK